ncbi:nuclear receptor coactivator 7 isoform X2 [Tiliqua scincoides]|uniref:nuclear receptor coactivator 7 isoform X2 n=1 Tax=Tiliqua scincoides TaxID=71010 RepID=UPI003462E68A
METKEEKKERRQGYFARLKKKRLAKQTSDTASANGCGTPTCRTQAGKDDGSKVVLAQTNDSQGNSKLSGEKEDYILDGEKKKKKSSQPKDIRRTDLKRYYSIDDNQSKTNEKKEKKMVSQKPHGTIEYTAGSHDTLNSIALKFNITPNKLVELNKLFTHTIVPGQVLYVPDYAPISTAAKLASSSPGAPVSPSSSDAEYDKLPDADLARRACRPLQRVLSSTSEEDEPVIVKFLKMNCRYFTDGKGVVGGVMIVTPNNIMFDPHKSDPLVIENGCEEYGLICPMEEVVSIALYNDISHMKIKDALPSPGEWEDLASEKDINPFSKFKSMNKEKRQQKVDNFVTLNSKVTESSDKKKSTDFEVLKCSENSALVTSRSPEASRDSIPTEASKGVALEIYTTEHSGERNALGVTKDNSLLEEDSFIDLEDTSSQTDGRDVGRLDRPNGCRRTEEVQLRATNKDNCEPSVLDSSGTKHETVPKEILDLESCEKLDVAPEMNKGGSSPTNKVDTHLDGNQELNKDKLIEFYLGKDELRSTIGVYKAEIKEEGNNKPIGIDLTLSSSHSQTTEVLLGKQAGPDSYSAERKEPLLEVGSAVAEKKGPEESVTSSLTPHLDNKSEIRLWLLQRIQVPIEDMLPSKEEKSKTPPMFLCIKVGKPMRKSFTAQSTTMAQQYGKRRKQPEYWFAVPRERVDHLYTFFVQWSPEVYGKDAKEQGFVVVEKEELDMIDNFFSEPSTKSWEIITVEEAKRRKSICSYCEEDGDEDDDTLPVLKNQSVLLENMHIEQLARCLPARVQGYPWRLVYSTQEHGTSLKTLYRKSTALDSPVLLVIKDMDNQIFGAYATHPFRFSDHYYGTGETFLYTFNPLFKVYKWSGENTYFINGDVSSLELGGGDGKFGLWLDADLYHGRSNSCSTFNNDILSKKEDFVVQDVEVWTFE